MFGVAPFLEPLQLTFWDIVVFHPCLVVWQLVFAFDHAVGQDTTSLSAISYVKLDEDFQDTYIEHIACSIVILFIVCSEDDQLHAIVNKVA